MCSLEALLHAGWEGWCGLTVDRAPNAHASREGALVEVCPSRGERMALSRVDGKAGDEQAMLVRMHYPRVRNLPGLRTARGGKGGQEKPARCVNILTEPSPRSVLTHSTKFPERQVMAIDRAVMDDVFSRSVTVIHHVRHDPISGDVAAVSALFPSSSTRSHPSSPKLRCAWPPENSTRETTESTYP